ncbi:sigma-70 family RNA polymerase sigma factor [Pseudodonghicola flavimaris]|uniref:Sigma-70 family RNA polymerase sigma factor n=1 Tax=Pseudodonghicola flavimaris TaxID=3050036 RepID=A0ABT7EY16_9RHOB|nr:sigma-70 family RNA polymerase sigma factor [Pseudodonghicola flavimaris]MDK3017165.1 sigma-70 family RNA polymerase sigma factor [Pseudodonghicola flavimaris]
MRELDQIAALTPALRRYARALMRGDRDAGDDLVQDCLERAVAALPHRRRDASLTAWVFRILINRHRDLMRQAARPGHLVPVEALRPEPAQPPGQEHHMALRETEVAIARLPEDQRRALLLVALDGASIDDAAAALDIPRGTLLSRLARARASLRSMTGRAGGDTAAPRPNGRP